jgi:uncharacterized protein YggE
MGIIAASLVTALVVGTGVPRAIAAGTSTVSQTSITVSGQGSASVTPDVAFVTIGVQQTDLQAGKAQSQANSIIADAISRIKALGIPDRDIQTQSITLYPQYDDRGVLTGFQATDTLSITVEKPGKAGSVIDAGVAAGANYNVSVSFGLKDDSLARTQALQAAIAQAQRKAAAAAKQLGISLAGAKMQVVENTAETPVPMPYAVGVPARSAASTPTPVQAGSLVIQDSVTITYTL